MGQETLGLCFNETMAGGVMRGVSDFREGEKQGRMAGEALAMHVTVAIDDVRAFIEDPEHEGRLSGTIDYPPLGTAIPSVVGRFNLFSPSDDPLMKLMIYELGFAHNGTDYYLVGRKEVKNDPGFDLWSDTTTLYIRLHRGRDSSGEVIAAGILTLGVTELARLVASMELSGSEGLIDKAETLGRFGRFFMGELWDSYVSHLV
jgi:cholesterol oxidase